MNTTLTAPQQLKELSIPENLSVLDTSIFLARHIDSAVEVLRPLVYKVFSENLWEGKFSSFSEYIESPEGLNKSQGYGSRLKTVEEHFIINGGATHEQLAGIDDYCLYEARKITQFKKTDGTYREATVEDQIAIARTLNRGDIKKLLTDQEATPHTPVWITYCETCGQSQATHP